MNFLRNLTNSVFLVIVCMNYCNSQTIRQLEQFEKNTFLYENDLSQILKNEKHHDNFIGYIGEKYQKIDIKFLEVMKSQNEYLIFGKIRIINDVKSFLGKIRIINIYYNGVSDVEGIYCYAIEIEYSFFEKKGNFTGKGKIDILKSNNLISYDDMFLSSDGYKNYQLEGVFIDKINSTKEKCNFGHSRIPNSQGLDIGTSEFIPSEEYLGFGWSTYLLEQDSILRRKSLYRWWE